MRGLASRGAKIRRSTKISRATVNAVTSGSGVESKKVGCPGGSQERNAEGGFMKFDVERTKKKFDGFMLPFLDNTVHYSATPMGMSQLMTFHLYWSVCFLGTRKK